jgi:hypothetical protein
VNDFLTPLEKQFQKIINRLSESFFQKVITQPNRPAVISLQEVQSSNPHVLDILQQGKYTIMRPLKIRTQPLPLRPNTLKNANRLIFLHMHNS